MRNGSSAAHDLANSYPKLGNDQTAASAARTAQMFRIEAYVRSSAQSRRVCIGFVQNAVPQKSTHVQLPSAYGKRKIGDRIKKLQGVHSIPIKSILPWQGLSASPSLAADLRNVSRQDSVVLNPVGRIRHPVDMSCTGDVFIWCFMRGGHAPEPKGLAYLNASYVLVSAARHHTSDGGTSDGGKTLQITTYCTTTVPPESLDCNVRVV